MSRLLLVSNRLPVTARVEHDQLIVTRSVGGLATGLRGPHENSGGLWIGWPGSISHLNAKQSAELQRGLTELRTVPIDLTPQEVRSFYEEFANGVLWPLFHSFIDRLPLDIHGWDVYREVNERFTNVVAEHYQPGDLVWVHDYQLALVPGLLRQRIPDARIGFFLHIPFPSSEVFRVLPWRHEILDGMLGADLIGFHTPSYLRHFTTSLLRILGIGAHVDHIRYTGREIRLGVFPMGIDAAVFSHLAEDPEVLKEVAAIRHEAADRKILVGIDRLDYTKGIPRRLLAVERLLEHEPSLREGIRLIQVTAPSREKVNAYMGFRRELEALVGRINGAYATANAVPIHNLYHSLSEHQVVALYRAADVMLVTPLRDGMNLVAKEFVASRTDEDGVLILSEFAGAASELGEALHVNPYDIDQVAATIKQALTMTDAERQSRMRALRQRVLAYDVHRWATSFIETLQHVSGKGKGGVQHLPSLSVLSALIGRVRTAIKTLQHVSGKGTDGQALSSPAEISALIGRVRKAEKVLLILDYDGTLVPFADTPDQAVPDSELLELLKALAARRGTSVHAVSGRTRDFIERWFGELPIGLHAEHGFWSRPHPGSPWHALRDMPVEWKEKVRPILEQFAAMTPGAFIEDKTTSLAWHYRMAEADFGELQAKELRLHLAELLSNVPVEVLTGDKVVEVRLHGVHKGMIVPSLHAEHEGTVTVLAMGDDRTDEDLFAALPPDSFTVHVGPGPSRAQYRLADSTMARQLLCAILD